MEQKHSEMTRTMSRKPVQSKTPTESRSDWRHVAWMGLQLNTPADWEIIAHSIDRKRGSLTFIDRRRQRMLLSWARTSQPIDLNRSMQDYKSRDQLDDKSVKIIDLRNNGFIGYFRSSAEAAHSSLTRLARQHSKRRLWVELTLDWPWGRDEWVERAIMESFTFENDPPDAMDEDDVIKMAKPTLWRAFGLEITAPSGWMLKTTDVKPADVTLTFEDLLNPRRECRVRRIGMVDAWYTGDLKPVIRKSIGMQVDCEYEAVTHHDTAALLGTSPEPMINLKKIAGRNRTRRDLVWHDESAYAVLAVTTISPESESVEPQSFKVTGYCPR